MMMGMTPDAPERIWVCNECKDLWIPVKQDDTTEYVRADLAPAWQPIESAPEDRAVLLFSPKSGPTVGHWGPYCVHNQPGFTHFKELDAPTSPEGAA